MTRRASRITHRVDATHDSRFTFWSVAAALTAVYGFTLAPDVTLWDSGEFNAAIRSLGIPHPPGTPLYILIANTWSKALGFLPQAVAVNLLSAVATALACGLLSGLITRWTQSRLAGVAAGLSSGTMLAVWQNATETEVYALSLLLAVLMVVVGDEAGRRDDRRLRMLLVFLMALAVPLQISALVAAPAGILLASTTSERGRIAWSQALPLAAALALAAGVALGSSGLVLTGLAVLVLSAFGAGRLPSEGLGSMVRLIAVVALGLSPLIFMLLRAPHDPFVNQGYPSTLATMMDVVTRQQYDVPGLWPRRAPLWVQLVNLVQYADWQVAFGLDSSVAASWRRTPWSVAALVLAILGWRRLRVVDGRGAAGVTVLLALASLGVVAVLNLRAGPSILDSVLPAGATHEPRERDYFFALAFAVAGALVGVGAVVTCRRWFRRRVPRNAGEPGAVMQSGRTAATAALLLACLPLILNWRAADRRPHGALASTFGEALLASAPPNAVLLVAGDNDSYTVWYRQVVHGDRRDVVPVTMSLLPAPWYRAELARRHGLLDAGTQWRGQRGSLDDLAANARAQGRPLAASLVVSPDIRQQLAPAWTLGGLVFIASSDTERGDRVDRAVTGTVADLVRQRIPAPRRGSDAATRWVNRLLQCPSQALLLGSAASGAQTPTLDSVCNLK